MPAHMPVLVDFWTVGDDDRTLSDVWAGLYNSYAYVSAATRSDTSIHYTLPSGATMQFEKGATDIVMQFRFTEVAEGV